MARGEAAVWTGSRGESVVLRFVLLRIGHCVASAVVEAGRVGPGRTSRYGPLRSEVCRRYMRVAARDGRARGADPRSDGDAAHARRRPALRLALARHSLSYLVYRMRISRNVTTSEDVKRKFG